MPPSTQQGSRAGLISALVIFVILFVTTTILFIYQNAETTKAKAQADLDRQKYTPVVSDTVLADPRVQELITTSKDATGPYAGMSAVEVAVAQRDAVIKKITGAGGSVSDATGQAEAALAEAMRKQQAVSVPPGAGLAAVIGSLADNIALQVNEKAAMAQQLAAAQDASDKVVAAQKALLEQRDAQIAE